MFEEDVQTIVIDNGSFSIRAGFSGDEAPRSVFRNVIGKPKNKSQTYAIEKDKDVFIGEDAINDAIQLILNSPIERGIIKNWDDIEKIWQYTFEKELRADPKKNILFF